MYCCICLSDKTDVIDIFDETGTNLKIADVVQQHLWFAPQRNEEILSFVCSCCWQSLAEFHVFYQQAEKAHAEHHLRKDALIIKLETEEGQCVNSIDPGKNHDFPTNKQLEDVKTNIVTENPLAEEQIKETEINLEKDINVLLHSAEKNPLDDEDAESEISYISQNVSETTDRNDSEETCTDEEFQESDASKKYNSRKRTRKRKLSQYNNERPQESAEVQQTQNECSPSKRNKNRRQKNSIDVQTMEEKTPKRKHKIRFNFDYKHTEAMIQKHIPMLCCLCDFVGKNFSHIKSHFRDCHPEERPYITCCDKQFTKRFYLAQHALKHEDPNCFRCNECNKSFTTNRGLTMHNLNYHATEEERTFCCELCPKKFATSNLLEMHKTSHIPKDEWKHFCPLCPTQKAFASEFLMNVHLNAQHKRAANVCHVCAKEIRDKNAFEKHVNRHFEDSGPRVPCPYSDCDSWLKDEDNLKKHLRRRHNPNDIIYNCTKCDKVCKNRGALTNHMHYSHSNGSLFQCEHCDKTFKKAISLKEHMTQHTGETLYSCPFCSRTFNSNANMYAHKKRNHPAEWEESRRNKQVGNLGQGVKTSTLLK